MPVPALRSIPLGASYKHLRKFSACLSVFSFKLYHKACEQFHRKFCGRCEKTNRRKACPAGKHHEPVAFAGLCRGQGGPQARRRSRRGGRSPPVSAQPKRPAARVPPANRPPGKTGQKKGSRRGNTVSLLRLCGGGYSSSLRTAIKASCGTSTLPS